MLLSKETDMTYNWDKDMMMLSYIYKENIYQLKDLQNQFQQEKNVGNLENKNAVLSSNI